MQYGWNQELRHHQQRITLEDLAKNLDHGKQSDIILFDFAKAFDTPTPPKPLRRTRHNQQVDSSLEGLKIRVSFTKITADWLKNADVTEVVSQLGVADDIFLAGETHKTRQRRLL